jgi:hypothetical protein
MHTNMLLIVFVCNIRQESLLCTACASHITRVLCLRKIVTCDGRGKLQEPFSMMTTSTVFLSERVSVGHRRLVLRASHEMPLSVQRLCCASEDP